MCAERLAPPTPRAALDKACAALKVFPLHGVVVLPGTPAPFHIFEPRYKALVEDALAGDRLLAVATLRDVCSGDRKSVVPVRTRAQ